MWLSQLTDTVNSLQGYNGEIVLNDHLNLNGKQIRNVAAPTSGTDVLTQAVAEASYSASALQPKLESTGSNPLKSVRRVNDPNQREQVSSFLNDLMSTPPSANSIYPSITVVGSNVQVAIPSSKFTFADRYSILLEGRTDLLALATSVAIVSISCSGNVVTVQTATPTGVVAGSSVTIASVSPASFNGSFTVATVIDSTHFTYQLDLGTASGSGGTVDLNNVWYYAIYKRQSNITLLGPYSGDVAQNRLEAGYDGYTILAVVVVTASGASISSSGGGGSPITGSPTAGCFF